MFTEQWLKGYLPYTIEILLCLSKVSAVKKISIKIDLMNHLPNSRYFSHMKMFYLYPKWLHLGS